MKKALFTIAMLFVVTTTFAQNEKKWDSKVSIDSGIYFNGDDGEFSVPITLEFSYCYKEKLSVGFRVGFMF